MVVVCVLALGLIGCGDPTTDRTLSRAGAGTDLSMAEAVLIDTAAGATTGALTSRDQINLGPAPRRKGAPATSGNVKGVQSKLAALGYNPGPIDGVAGPRTQAAVRSFQADHGLPVDGRLTSDLARHIQARAQAR